MSPACSFARIPTSSDSVSSHCFSLCSSKVLADRQTECRSPSLCPGWSFPSSPCPVDTCGFLKVQGQPRLLHEAFPRLLDSGSVYLTRVSALLRPFPSPWLLSCLSPLPRMSSPRNSDASWFVFLYPESSIILAWGKFSGGVCRKRVKGKRI